MNIHIQTIPNDAHRPGIGGADWQIDGNGDIIVRVSKMSDPRFEACLILHEVFEAVLCKFDGVTPEMVDAFDMPFDAANPGNNDAGDEPEAPYKIQHTLATAAERIASGHLRVDWKTYDKELGDLPVKPRLSSDGQAPQ